MNSAIATHESPGPILSAAALPGGFTGPSLSQEERSLIVRLRKGDEGAFDELVNKHHGALIRMALGHVADREAAETVARAQEEIRAERDRAFQELRGQVGDLAVEIAGRVVGESLDRGRHAKLIDEFIDGVGKAKR